MGSSQEDIRNIIPKRNEETGEIYTVIVTPYGNVEALEYTEFITRSILGLETSIEQMLEIIPITRFKNIISHVGNSDEIFVLFDNATIEVMNKKDFLGDFQEGVLETVDLGKENWNGKTGEEIIKYGNEVIFIEYELKRKMIKSFKERTKDNIFVK